jgi:predicted MFS family arabinose efflux permease
MSTIASSARAAAVPLLVLVIAGCIIAAVTNGVRTSLGLFTLPMTTDLGLSRETWGLAMAIQNLAWGIGQPIAGAIADRYGTGRVIVFGLLIYVAGLALMVVSPSGSLLNLSAGVMIGVATATSGFSIIMVAFGRNVPQEKRPLIFGIATAASSFGQFLFAPISQGFIANFGWANALLYLAGGVLVMLPLTYALRGKSHEPAGHVELPWTQILRKAWSFNSYRLLVIGFFVCGFHIAFIIVHMPAYLVQCGLSSEMGSWSIAMIGIFNIIGSLGMGYLAGRLPKQLLLATLYFIRSIAIALFVFLPVTEVSTLVFSAAIGLLWLSTVPPTAGLVSQFFGPRYMGMLYGIAFLSHQVGAFLGVWLGGYAYDQTGSYAIVWYLGILLGLASAAIHLPIREKSSPAFATAAA